MSKNPIAAGSILAVLAAVLFGLTTPIVKHAGANVGAFATAALLYAGASLGSSLRRSTAESSLTRRHVPRVLLVAVFGAVLAPAAFAWGLQRTGALASSLLLNLEAVFTVLLARTIYREPIGRRVIVACVLMTAGGSLLTLRLPQAGGSWSLMGLAATCAATLGWALDNTITRPLADLDARSVVFWKAAAGASLAAAIALVLGEPWPGAGASLALLACGATGYGLSLRLYLRAQRIVGAARTGSLFALAPFVGAAVAFAFGDRGGGTLILPASTLFAAAVYLHLTETHRHWHVHDAIVHDHPHTHDDGHHTHRHDPPVAGSHSHPHEHERLDHEHPHGADVHHRHEHD